MKTMVLPLFLLLAARGLAAPQDTGWVNVSNPYGRVGPVRVTAAGTLLLGTPRGLLRSGDRGDTWFASDSGLPADRPNELIPMGDRVIAATDSGVFHSDDDGRTWLPTTLPDWDFHYAVRAPDGAVYVTPPQGGEFRSDDTGRTWQRLGSKPGFPGHWAFDPRGWVYRPKFRCGIERSTDRGVSWSEFAGPSDSCLEIRILAILGEAIYVPRPGSKPARSTDGGSTWEYLTLPAGDPDVIHTEPGGALIARSWKSNLASISRDSGRSWSIENFVKRRWEVQRVSGDTFIALTNQAVYGASLERSTDGGRTWKGLIASFDGVKEIRLVPGTKTIFSSSEGDGVWRSTDGGSSWAKAFSGDADELAVHSDGTVLTGNFEGAFLSTDFGDTWHSLVDRGLTDTFIGSLAIAGEGTLFVGTWREAQEKETGGLWRSTDRGESWTRVSFESAYPPMRIPALGRRKLEVASVGIDPDGMVRVADIDRTLYRSSDNGETWQREEEVEMGEEEAWTRVVKTPLGEYFQGHRRSTDGGRSYVEITNGLSSTWGVCVLPLSDGSVVATAKGKVFRLPAGGNTWQQIHVPAGNVEMAVADDDALVISTDNDSKPAGVIFRKPLAQIDRDLPDPPIPPDQWEALDAPFARLTDLIVDCRSGVLWAATGGDTIAHSEDGGRSWTRELAGGPVKHLSIDPVDGSLVAQGLHVINSSTDGGKTWRLNTIGPGGRLSEPMTDGKINFIHFDTFDTSGRVLVTVDSIDEADPLSRWGAKDGSWVYRLDRDSGTWRLLDQPLKFNFAWFFSTTMGTVLAWSPGCELLRSEDGGNSWTWSGIGFHSDAPCPGCIYGGPVHSGGTEPIEAIASDPNGVLFAGRGSRGLYRSSDDGCTWSKTPDGLAWVYPLLVTADHRLFASIGPSIWMSDDEARTWKPFGAGLTSSKAFKMLEHPDGRLYVATTDGKIFRSIPAE